MKKRTWMCRYINKDGVEVQHMATGNAYANRERGVFECEKHSAYLM